MSGAHYPCAKPDLILFLTLTFSEVNDKDKKKRRGRTRTRNGRKIKAVTIKITRNVMLVYTHISFFNKWLSPSLYEFKLAIFTGSWIFINGITLLAVYANVYDGRNASKIKDQKEVCQCSHLGPSHALSLILPFRLGKEKPSQFLTKVFLLLASISFSNLNTWWFDVAAFENRRLRALHRHSATHPYGVSDWRCGQSACTEQQNIPAVT